MQLADQRPFQLGDIDIDPTTLMVAWPGDQAALQPRAMQVLVALAAAQGAVVSRDRLVAECWGGRAVSNDSVHRIIHLLRHLGRRSGAAGFDLQTVRGVGYRLAVAGGKGVEPARPLLAVLAFDNLTGDEDLAWLVDGVSVEILRTVAQATDLKVVGRSSSFALRGADKSSDNVVRLLGATHVLDGSVRRGGDRVRVSAELVECASRICLWSNQLDGPLSDVLTMQDTIASEVAAALSRTFSPAPRREPIDPVGFELYLRALQPDPLRTFLDLDLLRNATVRAPRFAPAWGLLAYSQAAFTRSIPGLPDLVERLAEAEAAARTAIGLDPETALAHAALSALQPLCGAFHSQRTCVDRAMATGRHDPRVVGHACGLDDNLGYQRRAQRLMSQAYAADPRGLGWYNAYLLEAVGRRDEAIEAYERDLARWPDSPLLLACALRSAYEAGEWERYDRTVADASSALLSTPFLAIMAANAAILRDPSSAATERLLESVGASTARSRMLPFTRAGWLASRGRGEAVFALLEGADYRPLFTQKGFWPPGEVGSNVLFSPTCKRLRRDRRFVGLCAQLGLVEYWSQTGVWPDCAAETAQWYDFKAEAAAQLESARRAG